MPHVFFSNICQLFVLLTSKAVPFIPQDIFLVNNHVLKTSSNWGRAHHCLLGSSPAPQAIRRDAGVVAAGWVSAERRILSSGGILILDESLGQAASFLKGECSWLEQVTIDYRSSACRTSKSPTINPRGDGWKSPEVFGAVSGGPT